MRRKSRPRSPSIQGEVALITCTFSLLGKLAAEERDVSDEVLEHLKRFIREEFDFDELQQALALKTFQLASESLLEFRDYALEFRRTYPDRVDLSEQVVRRLLQYASYDGFLSDRENGLVRSAALLLGLTEPAYELLVREVVPPGKILH
ncbi:MAG: TerB family tellurite resistance protein [Bdellovibrionales bacterium]|nr:TerB family tellurite resistance protein [Bdellovibrionales bacterium]